MALPTASAPPGVKSSKFPWPCQLAASGLPLNSLFPSNFSACADNERAPGAFNLIVVPHAYLVDVATKDRELETVSKMNPKIHLRRHLDRTDDLTGNLIETPALLIRRHSNPAEDPGGGCQTPRAAESKICGL